MSVMCHRIVSQVTGRALWVAAFGVLLSFFGGCQSLNPSFINTFGGSPIESLENPPGTVVIVLINRTAFPAELQLQVFEAAGFVGTTELNAPGNDFFVSGSDCEISTITFVSMTVTTGTEGGGENVPVPATPLTGGLNFRCGDVVSVTVSGTTGNFAVTVQII